MENLQDPDREILYATEQEMRGFASATHAEKRKGVSPELLDKTGGSTTARPRGPFVTPPNSINKRQVQSYQGILELMIACCDTEESSHTSSPTLYL